MNGKSEYTFHDIIVSSKGKIPSQIIVGPLCGKKITQYSKLDLSTIMSVHHEMERRFKEKFNCILYVNLLIFKFLFPFYNLDGSLRD